MVSFETRSEVAPAVHDTCAFTHFGAEARVLHDGPGAKSNCAGAQTRVGAQADADDLALRALRLLGLNARVASDRRLALVLG
jgi:hypothetical protein